VNNNREWIYFSSFELDMETTVDDTSQIMLDWSDDGGHTWSNEIWRSVGKIGQYNWRAVWDRLGASRHRNYKITVTDPVKWVITNANLEVTFGTS
jgi:hypothetical protein